MKLVINYDLLEKIFEAKHGISLAELKLELKIYTTITIPFSILEYSETGNLPSTIIYSTIAITNGLLAGRIIEMSFLDMYKSRAKKHLSELANELNHYCIETNEELIKKAKKYKTEYGLDTESFPPKLMQKKYIMVPVHNNWGNNERSLVQEHIIGSKEYALSYGEPEEKKKVYSLKPARKFTKN